MSEMKYKSFQLEAVKADFGQRIVEGYASVFGVKDSYGEIVDPGAFANTLGKRTIKVREQHEKPIGKIISAKEDTYGLYVIMQISRTARGDECLILAADGVMGMSIGYREIAGYGAPDGWHISEIDLREVSLTDLPACEPAVVTAVKEDDPTPEEKQATELKELHAALVTLSAYATQGSFPPVDMQLLKDAHEAIKSAFEASQLPADEEVLRMLAETTLSKLKEVSNE